jgi:hypothetical protein
VVIGLVAGMSWGNALYVGVLLACPLMMVFMMAGGHGGQHPHGHAGHEPREPEHHDGAPRGRGG